MKGLTQLIRIEVYYSQLLPKQKSKEMHCTYYNRISNSLDIDLPPFVIGPICRDGQVDL